MAPLEHTVMPSLAQIGSKNSDGMAPFCRIPWDHMGSCPNKRPLCISEPKQERPVFGLSRKHPNRI
jgi:hypothetical protein